jgi:hypothetical protein
VGALETLDADPVRRASPGLRLQRGVPAENAFNEYIKANNAWDRFLQNFGCDVDSIEPELQRRWADASREIRQAEKALSRLELLPKDHEDGSPCGVGSRCSEPLREVPSAPHKTDLGWVRACKEEGEDPSSLGCLPFRWHLLP